MIDNSDYSLSVKYDEGYLYGYVNLKSGKFGDNKIVVPVSTVGVGSNMSKAFGLKFNMKADSVIVINGETDSYVANDEYYDYNRFRFYPEEKKTENSGNYNIVTQFVHDELTLPETNRTVERKSNEVGRLNFGISDPNDDNYNSQSDFYAKNNVIEFRIPWYMLGVLNISKGVALNSFNKTGEAAPINIDNISLGIAFADQSGEVALNKINYSTADSKFHTRLKKSYYYIQKTLNTLFAE